MEHRRLSAPVGFDADGRHYGLMWSGEPALSGSALALADWLAAECATSFGPEPEASRAS